MQMARRAIGAAKTALVLRILRTLGSHNSRHRERIAEGGMTSDGIPSAVKPWARPSAKLATPPTSWPPVIRTFSGVGIYISWLGRRPMPFGFLFLSVPGTKQRRNWPVIWDRRHQH